MECRNRVAFWRSYDHQVWALSGIMDRSTGFVEFLAANAAFTPA
jgi:hypothetical protein